MYPHAITDHENSGPQILVVYHHIKQVYGNSPATITIMNHYGHYLAFQVQVRGINETVPESSTWKV